ncbi:MAG: hypothetical protein AAF716_19665 [Cyanobacteria bacterium P01_D01_bin.1]
MGRFLIRALAPLAAVALIVALDKQQKKKRKALRRGHLQLMKGAYQAEIITNSKRVSISIEDLPTDKAITFGAFPYENQEHLDNNSGFITSTGKLSSDPLLMPVPTNEKTLRRIDQRTKTINHGEELA